MAHGRPDTLRIAGGPLSRPLPGAPNLRGDRTAVLGSIKLQATSPSLEHHFPLAQLVCQSSASLSQSTPSPRVDRRPNFDGFHVLSTDRPQHSPQIHHQLGLPVLRTSNPLRCLMAQTHRKLYDNSSNVATDLLGWLKPVDEVYSSSRPCLSILSCACTLPLQACQGLSKAWGCCRCR